MLVRSFLLIEAANQRRPTRSLSPWYVSNRLMVGDVEDAVNPRPPTGRRALNKIASRHINFERNCPGSRPVPPSKSKDRTVEHERLFGWTDRVHGRWQAVRACHRGPAPAG